MFVLPPLPPLPGEPQPIDPIPGPVVSLHFDEKSRCLHICADIKHRPPPLIPRPLKESPKDRAAPHRRVCFCHLPVVPLFTLHAQYQVVQNIEAPCFGKRQIKSVAINLDALLDYSFPN
jgi:hypothetical protein